MDPNATLELIRDYADSILGDTQSDSEATMLAEAVQDLDEWLTKGGFLPAAWANTPPTD